MQRKQFIQKLGAAAGLLSLGAFPFSALAGGDERSLRLLHTNDLHIGLQQSNWQAVRTYINETGNEHTLILDAGDMFHGSGIMSNADICDIIRSMNYDAVTIGEHDFDMGMEALANRIACAKFPYVISNYDLRGTALEYGTKPYHIIYKQGVKIGIYGMGINTCGLTEKNISDQVKFLDPLITANEISDTLKLREACDLVVPFPHGLYTGWRKN